MNLDALTEHSNTVRPLSLVADRPIRIAEKQKRQMKDLDWKTTYRYRNTNTIISGEHRFKVYGRLGILQRK